jgi:hypothetical protein
MTNITPRLPGILVTWQQATLDPGGLFLQYNVYRRVSGTIPWTRIAILSDVTAHSYRDYAAVSRVLYDYAVTQSEVIGASVIESAVATPVHGEVGFNWAYLHAVADPSQFVPLYSFSVLEQVNQEVVFRAAWGRTAPTAFVGDLDYSTHRIQGLPDVHRGEIWPALRALLSLQPAAAAVFCLRVGVDATRYFVNIKSAQRQGSQGLQDQTVEFSQVNYDEAVGVT